MARNETNKALEGLFPTLEEVEEREQVQEIETKEEPKKETKKATKTETEPQKNDIIESTTKKKAIGRPRINPTEPYKITFIVDEEIEEYMKQQPFITMESRKDYVNRLIKEETKKETKSQNDDIIKNQTKKRPIGRPRINPEEPYKITFIVDEEIRDYMKQQPYITMESRKDYVNRLIKEDFEKRIGATTQDNEESIQRKWNDYKERVRRSF